MAGSLLEGKVQMKYNISVHKFTISLFPDVPDAPPSRPLVVRMDSRSVDLSWAPPRRTHHHPVTSYKIFIK